MAKVETRVEAAAAEPPAAGAGEGAAAHRGGGPVMSDASEVSAPTGGATKSWNEPPSLAEEDFVRGDVLFDRYIVERKLGEGGMGAVWLVRDPEFGCHRAMKLIVSRIATDPEALARFRREARIQDRLTHPGAVRIYDVQVKRDAAFITMEYVPGRSLNQVLQPSVPMPLDWTTRILVQLCEVLQLAHDHKIVHRDLKPSNLMLVDEGPEGGERLKILDFGIAKILESETLSSSDPRTGTGYNPGTPLYSSPEQISGLAVDGRSDIYSVGLILYEMLTGYRAFNGNVHSLMMQHTSVPPSPFAVVNPRAHVPPVVEEVVLKCLAKAPEDRPQSPRELSALFQQAVAASPKPWPRKHVNRRMVAIGGAVALPVLLLGLGWSYVGRGTPNVAGSRATVVVPHEVDRWVRQGFTRDVAAAETDGWPRVLIGPEGRGRFRRMTGGVYLPEGYQAGAAQAEDGYPQRLTRKDGTAWIRIAGGSFTMGGLETAPAYNPQKPLSDRPAHLVDVAGFYLQETEVTNGQVETYYQAAGKDPWPKWLELYNRLRAEIGPERAREHPAGLLPRHEADALARSVGGMLPTEAQWEYAARSRGKPNRYVWGNDEPTREKANIDYQPQAGQPTAEVRSFRLDRTEQGVFDLTGNLQEWCRDIWAPYSGDPPRDGPPKYVIRGNSYYGYVDQCGTTRREDRAETDQEAETLGFRVVIETPAPPGAGAGPNP
jgi:serine/threonine-protein kinase